ncbi:MAG: PAS domain-containing protein [Azospirillaceae bacterium]|nr:PAS domain-containing protein [Azospirillaceae bacterium]
MVMNIFGRWASARLAAIDESAALIEFALDGTIITANQNFLNAMGYRLDAIKGQNHGLFVDPACRDSDDDRRLWRKRRRGEFAVMEYKRTGKGDKQVSLEASYNPRLGPGSKPTVWSRFPPIFHGKMLNRSSFREISEAIVRSQANIQFEMAGTIITANKHFLDTPPYRLDETKGNHG